MGGLKLGKEAQAKFDEARQNADYSGYLEKKGAKRKNWNNRWFVLKDNYLFYCKNPKSNPQGIINLHACTVSKTEGPTARPFSYSLLAPKSVSIDAKWTNRTYFMAAKSEEDRDNWMRVLEESGRKAVERAAQAKKERENKEKDSKGSSSPPAAHKELDNSQKTGKDVKDMESDDDKPTKKGNEPPSSGESSDEKADKDSDKEEKKPSKKQESESEEEEKEEKKADKKEKKHHKSKKEKKNKKEKKEEKKEPPKEEVKKETPKEEVKQETPKPEVQPEQKPAQKTESEDDDDDEDEDSS